jgi:hypothetical protein
VQKATHIRAHGLLKFGVGILMVPGADRNASYLSQLADPSTDLPRLYHPRLFPKHIQQVPCDADQVNIWSLFA